MYKRFWKNVDVKETDGESTYYYYYYSDYVGQRC